MKGLLEGAILDWLHDTLNAVFTVISEGLFNDTGLSGIFKTINLIFLAVGGMMMVCIVLYRILMSLFEEAAGKPRDQVISELVIGAVKASMMIYFLPVLLSFILNQLVYPFCTYLFVEAGTFSSDAIKSFIDLWFEGKFQMSGFALLLINLFFLAVMVSFVFRFCQFHAEWVYIQLFSVFVSVSILTDRNNMVADYLKSVGCEFVSLIVAISAMTGIMALLAKPDIVGSDILLIVGLGMVEIKGVGLVSLLFGGRPPIGIMRSVSSGVRNITGMFRK